MAGRRQRPPCVPVLGKSNSIPWWLHAVTEVQGKPQTECFQVKVAGILLGRARRNLGSSLRGREAGARRPGGLFTAPLLRTVGLVRSHSLRVPGGECVCFLWWDILFPSDAFFFFCKKNCSEPSPPSWKAQERFSGCLEEQQCQPLGLSHCPPRGGQSHLPATRGGSCWVSARLPAQVFAGSFLLATRVPVLPPLLLSPQHLHGATFCGWRLL